MTTNKTFADDLRQMMDAWNKIEAAAKQQFPLASKEDLYKICGSAMTHALGMDK